MVEKTEAAAAPAPKADVDPKAEAGLLVDPNAGAGVGAAAAGVDGVDVPEEVAADPPKLKPVDPNDAGLLPPLKAPKPPDVVAEPNADAGDEDVAAEPNADGFPNADDWPKAGVVDCGVVDGCPNALEAGLVAGVVGVNAAGAGVDEA